MSCQKYKKDTREVTDTQMEDKMEMAMTTTTEIDIAITETDIMTMEEEEDTTEINQEKELNETKTTKNYL